MNLTYAVDRLFEVGGCLHRIWSWSDCPMVGDIPRCWRCSASLPGRFELSIKQNLMFKCYRATWAPIGEPLEDDHAADERHAPWSHL